MIEALFLVCICLLFGIFALHEGWREYHLRKLAKASYEERNNVYNTRSHWISKLNESEEKWIEHFKEIKASHEDDLLEIKASHEDDLSDQANQLRAEYSEAMNDLKKSHEKAIEAARVSSRRQTKAVRFGNAAQHSLLPLLAAQEDGIDPRDIRWLGGVFDFVVFKNLHRSDDMPIEIIFADAKTSVRISNIINAKDKVGKYKKYDPAYTFFNDDQTRVAKAIEQNRISYQLWMADSNTEEFQVRSYSSDSPSRHFGNYNKEKENDTSGKEDPGKPV